MRALTLKKVKFLFRSSHEQLQRLVVSSDVVDPVIPEIVQALLSSTRDPDASIVTTAGECLGILGAVDPGRLEKNDDLSAAATNLDGVPLAVTEEAFVIDLVNVLIRTLIASSGTSDTDACSYSIQEVLKACGIRGPAPMSTVAGRLWNRLSDSAREILQPFLTSLYSRNETQPAFAVPIFRAAKGGGRPDDDMTFQQWISDWCCHLISKVKTREARSVFDACVAIVRKEAVGTAQFLLPHVVLAALGRNSIAFKMARKRPREWPQNGILKKDIRPN